MNCHMNVPFQGLCHSTRYFYPHTHTYKRFFFSLPHPQHRASRYNRMFNCCSLVFCVRSFIFFYFCSKEFSRKMNNSHHIQCVLAPHLNATEESIAFNRFHGASFNVEINKSTIFLISTTIPLWNEHTMRILLLNYHNSTYDFHWWLHRMKPTFPLSLSVQLVLLSTCCSLKTIDTVEKCISRDLSNDLLFWAKPCINFIEIHAK